MEFIARNYNQMAPAVYSALAEKGIPSTSRNGNVLRLPGVTTLVVERPWERVNFSPIRDANPFFHLIEAMAMLSSMNDAPFLAHFAKNMMSFSDDGKGYNAFYGSRMRCQWGDQLLQVIRELKEKPDSRQCVVQIWDPADLWRNTKDKACNLCLMFSVAANGSLEMTSINRSNDAIWGIVTGANIVHLSFFQEYVAGALGRRAGAWSHVSNNLHVYTDNPQWAKMRDDKETHDLYSGDFLISDQLIPNEGMHSMFDTSLLVLAGSMHKAVEDGTTLQIGSVMMNFLFEHLPFFGHTAVPVFNAWQLRKQGAKREEILDMLRRVRSEDWAIACTHWMERRWAKEATQ